MKNRLFTSIILILSVSLLVILSTGLGLAEEESPELDNLIFLPGVLNHKQSGLSITGKITTNGNIPLGGITVSTNDGVSAVTNSDGIYALNNLDEQSYSVAPSKAGYTFSPASAQVVVPPSIIQLNFTTNLQCENIVPNSGFETTDYWWKLPLTVYPAAYSAAQHHSGVQSIRTGIINPLDNRYSYSSVRTPSISIPSTATGAVLGFWLYPLSGQVVGLQSLPPMPTGIDFEKSPLAGDVQYAVVLDAYDNVLETLVWQLRDSATWTYYEFNLLKYAGRSIQIHIGTYNDGYNGISAMYVDDASLTLCPATTPPTPTVTPPPGACTNLMDNPGFETASDWEIPITRYPAGYSNVEKYSGSWSMRTGIINPADNRYSYSDFRQAVSIPSNISRAILRMRLFPLSGEVVGQNIQSLPDATPSGKPFELAPEASDLQYVLILDQWQNWIDTLIWQRSDSHTWTYYEFDLSRYKGRTIYVQFGTYNDGWNGISAMFVDEVYLDDCAVAPTPGPTSTPTSTALPTSTPTSTPIPTATPTPTPTLVPTATTTPGACLNYLVNSNFEGTNGWTIPYTDYPAGYSTTRSHSPSWSMRTGITNFYDNTYSYSDFRQAVSIPLSAHSVRLKVWLYPQSGEALSAPLPEIPHTQIFGEEPLAYDAQYILVLDQWQNWIDTLIWMKSDSQTWTYYEINLDDYAGWSIMLQPGTYNDGYGGITSMYVDDMVLEVCP
jgi:hypothetical protein